MCSRAGSSRKREFIENLGRTYEVWSERQADKYYYELIKNCQEFSGNQTLGRNYIDIKVYGHKSGQFIIFYRILNIQEIEIVRFLDSKMNLSLIFSELQNCWGQ